MQPIVTTHRSAISTPVTNTLTVPVAAGADTTRRALRQLDLSGPAIRAMRALGLTDRVTLTPGGLSWRPEGWSGQIDVSVDVRVEPDREDGSSLTIITRFSATDERTQERLLDAWPLLGSLAAELVRRAARTLKQYAEDDRFEEPEPIDEHARAAY
jgi:hypothetical protein